MENSKEMIAVLKRRKDQDGIRRKPLDMPIANKTGSLDALRSDVGTVYSPKGTLRVGHHLRRHAADRLRPRQPRSSSDFGDGPDPRRVARKVSFQTCLRRERLAQLL